MTANNEATKDNIRKQVRNVKGVLIGDSPLAKVSAALNQAFIAIRQRHPDVPNVQLVVGANGRTKRNSLQWGHFAPKSWEGSKAIHEIAITGENLVRGAEAVLGTLLHEAAHAMAEVREVQDTSRQGRWHNAKFKELAEEVGIVVEKDKSIGWSITTLPPETAKVYKAELAALKKSIDGYRVGTMKERVKKPKTTVAIVCGCRKVSVPVSFFEKGGLTCDECGSPFDELFPDAA